MKFYSFQLFSITPTNATTFYAIVQKSQFHSLLTTPSLVSLYHSIFSKHLQFISQKLYYHKFHIDRKGMFTKALSVLKEHQLDQTATLLRKDQFAIEKKPGSSKINIRENIGRLEIFLSFQIKQAELTKLQNNPVFQSKNSVRIKRKHQVGDIFKDYGEFENILKGEKTKLSHQPGEVLCILPWCCQGHYPTFTLSAFQQMFLKYDHWKERVRIVAVNIQNDDEAIERNIQYYHNLNFIHLLVWQLKDKKLKTNIEQLLAFPPIVLVNKFGKLDYFGKIKDLQLQQRINQLIQQQKEQKTHLQAESAVSADSFKEVLQKQQLNYSQERLQKLFMSVDLVCFKFQRTVKCIKGALSIKRRADATIIKDDQQALETVQAFFSNYPDIKLQIDTVDYVSVPNTEGVKCWECAKPLQYPFYWLRWQEGTKFGCRECVEATTDLEGHHYKYQKNSVLLTGQWKKLAVKNLGNNIQPIHPKVVNSRHSYLCNGCYSGSKQIGKVRYICQGCRMHPYQYRDDYVDFCQNCHDSIIRKELQVEERIKKEGHQSNHPLLRVLYYIKGYYDF